MRPDPDVGRTFRATAKGAGAGTRMPDAGTRPPLTCIFFHPDCDRRLRSFT